MQNKTLVGLTQFHDTKPLTVAKKQHEVSATEDSLLYLKKEEALMGLTQFHTTQNLTVAKKQHGVNFTLKRSSDGLNPISYKMNPCSLLQETT